MTNREGDVPMTDWTNEELDRIGAAEEVQIQSRRQNGTLRDPVTIWVVRQGNSLYVRSVKGRTGGWFSGIETRREGHIRAGGVEKDVSFVDVESNLNDDVDAAYRGKYRGYLARSVLSVETPRARASTLRLMPLV